MIFEHKSVLLMETVDSLNVKPDGIYVDGTLGGGGHAYEVSRRLGEKGRLIGIDQDADAIAAATERLLPFKDKVTIVRSNYKNIREVLFNLGIEKVDGIYLDLGVSSYQLDGGPWILLQRGCPAGYENGSEKRQDRGGYRKRLQRDGAV